MSHNLPAIRNWHASRSLECRREPVRRLGRPSIKSLKSTRKLFSYRETDTPFIQLIVGGLTEALRVTSRETLSQTFTSKQAQAVATGDLQGMLAALKDDWTINRYYVTGIISEEIFDEHCEFSDPTIAFKGLQTWKRNMALVVPFQEDPKIELLSLQPCGLSADGCTMLQADWFLSTYIKLPWRPLITLRGRTTYTLNSDANKVVRHVEAWSISGTDALLQLFRASDRSQMPIPRLTVTAPPPKD